MYFVVFLGILTVVSAGQRPPMSGFPTYPKEASPMDPEPCCAPEQYTHHISANTAVLEQGKLSAAFVLSRGAYDFINKLIGLETVLDFSNGTEDIFKIILDFNKRKGYNITKVKGVVECQKFEIQEEEFPENCIPDDAVFVGSATVGDRALLSDQWYVSKNDSNGETAHIVYSIKAEGCVSLGSDRRIFDSNTGAEIRSESRRWYDFNLGIDDPDRWFKPPSECEGAKVTNFKPARLRHGPMFGGKGNTL